MKKMLLLCTGLFLAAGIASASPVTSENIVGYKKYTGAESGYTILTPNFVKVQGANQSFQLKNIMGNFTRGDSLQSMNLQGNVSGEAFWMTSPQVTIAGWYDEERNPLGDLEIDAGTAFFVLTALDNEFYVAGQVENENVVVNCDEGLNLIGNSSPVDLKFEDFAFDGVVRGDSIQFIDESGSVYTEAFWMTSPQVTTAGWYDEERTPLGKEIIPSGLGFFFLCQNDDVKVTIPAPILN